MDAAMNILWLFGQILSIGALIAGFALSVLYWRLHEPGPSSTVDEEKLGGVEVEIRRAA